MNRLFQRLKSIFPEFLIILSMLMASGMFPYYFDDAFISFRITENIKNGIGPYLFENRNFYSSTSLFYPYFNLIFSLALGSGWIHLIPSWNGLLIGLSFCICLRLSGASLPQKNIIVLLLLPWLLGHRNLLYGNSGLETGLYMVLLAACLHIKKLRIFSPWLIFIRPDGWLAGWAVLIDCLLSKDKKSSLKIAAGILISLFLWAMAGFFLYGTALPQSIIAKSNHHINRILEIEKGLSYLLFAGQIFLLAVFLFAVYNYSNFLKQVRLVLIWTILYLSFFSLGAAWWPWYLPPLYVSFWFLGMKAASRILNEMNISGSKLILLTAIFLFSAIWQLKTEIPVISKSSEACVIRMQSSKSLAAFLKDSIPRGRTILLEPLGLMAWYGPELSILDYPGLASPEMSDYLKSLSWKIPHRLTDSRTDSAIIRHFKPDAMAIWPEEQEAFRKSSDFRYLYKLRKTLPYYPGDERMDSVSVFVRIRN